MLSNLVAQYSSEHYMPPLYNGASSNADDPDEIRIDLSTMVSSSFNVSVKRYDGTENQCVISLSPRNNTTDLGFRSIS